MIRRVKDAGGESHFVVSGDVDEARFLQALSHLEPKPVKIDVGAGRKTVEHIWDFDPVASSALNESLGLKQTKGLLGMLGLAVI